MNGVDFYFSRKLFVFVLFIKAKFYVLGMLMSKVGLIECLVKFIFLGIIRISVDSFTKLNGWLFLLFWLLVADIEDGVLETHSYEMMLNFRMEE